MQKLLIKSPSTCSNQLLNLKSDLKHFLQEFSNLDEHDLTMIFLLHSPATPHTHQLKTLAKNIKQVTLAPSMPALHTSWHSKAAGGMARWPGRIRQQALL